jgi:hypothetical protein
MRWLDDDPSLARCALLAAAVGFAGNAYFLLGLSSAAAFSAAALLFPMVAAVCLAAIAVIGVREVLPTARCRGRSSSPPAGLWSRRCSASASCRRLRATS